MRSRPDNRRERKRVVSQEEFGKTRDTVKKKPTDRTKVGGQTVAASEDVPRYLVESDKTGKRQITSPTR